MLRVGGRTLCLAFEGTAGRIPGPGVHVSFHPHQVLTNKSHLWVEENVWRMEIYLSLGVLALGTLSLLAVTSLPSIANSLNWREFSFVQVKQGCLWQRAWARLPWPRVCQHPPLCEWPRL